MMNDRPAYARGAAEHPLLTDTIGAHLARTARRYPDREALVDVASGRRWTYAQFDAAVDELALGLIEHGIAPGDRVAIWSPNCPEWIQLQFATARIGAILVTVNPTYRSHELGWVLRQSGTRLLVSAVAHRHSDYRAMVGQVRGGCPELAGVAYLGEDCWHRLVGAGRLADPARLTERSVTLRPGHAINIQYTSGTTGFPKGATLSHRNILNNGYSVGERLGYTERDRVCLPVPLYHCFGMVLGNLAALTHGACVVLPSPTFDPEAALRAVQNEQCTALYGVPTMFIAELEHPRFDLYDLTSLRTGIMAGSPCPVEVMKRVVRQMNMAEVAICYGMTETSPVSTMTSRDDDLSRRTGTVGRVMPHVEVRIADPRTGHTLPLGVPGELCTRGYSVMLGYWDEPERTAEAIDGDGWMHSGDLAVMDADGYVNIVGRTKDMVIRGGENIYPREIE
jgi:fatty-acyl-CoA synthase